MRRRIATPLAIFGVSLTFAAALAPGPVDTKFSVGATGLILYVLALFLTDEK